MATYNTVEVISRDEWPAGRLAYGAPCEGDVAYTGAKAGALPVSTSKSYTPLMSFQTESDPTKGTRRNWEKIKQSGEISFTPLEKLSVKTECFVVPQIFNLATWFVRQQGCGISQKVNRLGPLEGHLVYRRNSTIVEYENQVLEEPYRSALLKHETAILEAISTTQQSAFVSSTSQYDALTEMMEFKETLSFLQSFVGGAATLLSRLKDTDPPTFKAARKLNAKQMLRSNNKALQKLGGRWMAYRYAIMPLVYSIRDINETLSKRDAEYQSGRSKDLIKTEVTLDDYALPKEGFRVVHICKLESKVSSLYKVRYLHGALQRILSQVAFNPFTTGWELIPFSFVIDWFLNVGDAITCATRVDLSDDGNGVTSIRSTHVDKIVLHDSTVDRSRFSIGAWMDAPAVTKSFEHKHFVQASLQDTTKEHYKRFTFGRPKPSLSFDLNLNWKRTIDGLVLSHKPISKLLRSL